MGRTPKAEKDPNKPKRAQSAYFLFMADFRAQCKKTGDVNTSNVAEFTKVASGKWRKLSDAEKKPYEAKSAKEKERYEKEMSTYVPPPGLGGRGSRKRKNPDAPKRPKSAYLYFLEKFRAEHSDLGHKEIISKGADAWAKLSDKDKEPFSKLYNEEKERYNSKIQAMNGGGDADADDDDDEDVSD